MKYSVILLAAGKGSRTNLEYNKVFFKFDNGEVLITKTISPFLNDIDCTQIIVVSSKDELRALQGLFNDNKIEYTIGGKTRQDSVYNGLQCVVNEYVMIHDGARCFITKTLVDSCKEALKENDACLLMVPLIDTIKKVVNGYVDNTPLRSDYYAAQTPQCFKTSLIKECYEKGHLDGVIASDDAQLIEKYSTSLIKVVLGSYENKKITTNEDLK